MNCVVFFSLSCFLQRGKGGGVFGNGLIGRRGRYKRLKRPPFIQTPVEMNCAIDAMDERKCSRVRQMLCGGLGCGWHFGGCVLLGCGNNTQTLLLLLLAVAHISTRRLNFPHLFPGVGVSCDVYRQQQQHDKNEPRRRRNSFLDLSLLYIPFDSILDLISS